MSAEIIPFDFEETAVRVVLRGGAPWFVAADVCRVLGISNSRDAVSRLDDDERDGVGSTDTIGRVQTMQVVSESGLYALIFTSRKEEAKRFRKWVTSEVLPALRQHGRYEIGAQASAPRTGGTAGFLSAAARDAELWLSLIREARLNSGTRAGRRIWALSPFPPLEGGVSYAGRASPEEGLACRAHLLAQIAALPEGAELSAQGLRWVNGYLFVANAPIPGLLALFVGSDWAEGRHVAALRAVPGAAPHGPLTLGGIVTRGTLLPLGAEGDA